MFIFLHFISALHTSTDARIWVFKLNELCRLSVLVRVKLGASPLQRSVSTGADEMGRACRRQQRRRKLARRGRWSDEWCRLGRLSTSSSSDCPTNDSLPSSWRLRPPGSEAVVLISFRRESREKTGRPNLMSNCGGKYESKINKQY